MQLSNFGNLEGKELAFLKIDYLYWDFLRSTYNIEEPFLYSVFLAFLVTGMSIIQEKLYH